MNEKKGLITKVIGKCEKEVFEGALANLLKSMPKQNVKGFICKICTKM